MNLRQLQATFDTQEKCLAFIEKCRWPEGIRCITCGCDRISRITSSSKKQAVRYIFECMEPTCGQQFTATSGTILHDTHLPLQTWLMAIALLTQAKKGMSAMQLKTHLGLGSYKTAWHLCHRIREAMKSNGGPLGGTVEIDETFVGGKQRSHKRQLKNKECVLGIRQRGGELRLTQIQDRSRASIEDVVLAQVDGSCERIMTDDLASYDFSLTKLRKAKHDTIKHSEHIYVKGDVTTNSIESAFSLFKRGLVGSFHAVSPKHLQRYLDEFSYRFNGRKDPELFDKTVRNIVQGKTLPLATLLS